MKKVLVVDDELLNRDVIKKILTKEGLCVLEASNGLEALEVLEKNEMNLILMDLMMPVMDGFEAIEIISKTHIVPIIAITALDDNKTHQKVLKLGAIGFITKPFELKRLVQSVKIAIK